MVGRVLFRKMPLHSIATIEEKSRKLTWFVLPRLASASLKYLTYMQDHTHHENKAIFLKYI